MSSHSSSSTSAQSLHTFFSYWFPEVVSLALLTILPIVTDSYIIASLKSTTTYGALAAATRLIHFIIKIAEAVPVATTVLISRANGAKQYDSCGGYLFESLWTTLFIGLFWAITFFVFAKPIYLFLGVSEKMIPIGVPYLQLQAFTIPLIFIFGSLIGFFKGIKNTRVPLYINLIGIIIFLTVDYVFVFGKFGAPALGMQGSALASVIRYFSMNLIIIGVLLFDAKYGAYFSKKSLTSFRLHEVYNLFSMSLPIVIDKAMLALAYIWLGSMIGSVGKIGIAGLEVMRNIERFSLLPALGFAQVITFLVGNSLGAADYEGARQVVKRGLLFSMAMTVFVTAFIFWKYQMVIGLFDQKGRLIDFLYPVVGITGLLIVLDYTQIIFAAALRSAGDVTLVMVTRTLACVCFFLPITYGLSRINALDPQIKFILIYGMYYATTGIMTVVFARRWWNEGWIKE